MMENSAFEEFITEYENRFLDYKASRRYEIHSIECFVGWGSGLACILFSEALNCFWLAIIGSLLAAIATISLMIITKKDLKIAHFSPEKNIVLSFMITKYRGENDFFVFVNELLLRCENKEAFAYVIKDMIFGVLIPFAFGFIAVKFGTQEHFDIYFACTLLIIILCQIAIIIFITRQKHVNHTLSKASLKQDLLKLKISEQ